MYFPQLSAPRQSRVTVSRFLGLDRRPRGQEGSFREMENLCADGYPTLTVRRPRGVAGSAVSPGGPRHIPHPHRRATVRPALLGLGVQHLGDELRLAQRQRHPGPERRR